MTSTLESTPVTETSDERPGWLRRIGMDTAYNLTALFFAIPAFVVTVATVSLGLALLVLLFGVPVLAVSAYAARGFAHVERVRIRSLVPGDGPTGAAPSPAYRRAPSEGSWLVRVAAPLRDPQSWFDLGWTVLAFVSSIVVFVVTVVWWSIALGGLTYWFWERFIPFDDDQEFLVEVLRLGEGRRDESVLMFVFGVVAVLTVPLVVRACALAHSGLGRVLLCSRE